MPDLDNIPTAKTADELAALRASDPAAFDDDDTAEAERLAAEKAEADRVAAEKAESAKSDQVDRKKFDGVLGDLRDTRVTLAQERERAEALAAELAALKAGPKIDYDAEIEALAQKYADDDDFTHDDYMAQRDALLIGKVKADARAEIQQEQAQAQAQKAEQDWATAANAFVEAHPEYAAGEAKVDLEAALHGVFAKFPAASDADKLERAHKIVLAMNGKAEPAPATEPAKGPHAARDASDAQAAAKASAAPPPVNGGVSSAGGPIGNVDLTNLKPGTFSKNLSKDQQAAALGGADAL